MKKIGKIYHETSQNREFFEIYVGHYDGQIKIQESELEDAKWLPIDEVLKLEKLTPALKKSIGLYKQQRI